MDKHRLDCELEKSKSDKACESKIITDKYKADQKLQAEKYKADKAYEAKLAATDALQQVTLRAVDALISQGHTSAVIDLLQKLHISAPPRAPGRPRVPSSVEIDPLPEMESDSEEEPQVPAAPADTTPAGLVRRFFAELSTCDRYMDLLKTVHGNAPVKFCSTDALYALFTTFCAPFVDYVPKIDTFSKTCARIKVVGDGVRPYVQGHKVRGYILLDPEVLALRI